MIKSLSMMKNVGEVCEQLRRKMYGKDATAKDYKDSFIINNSIDNFSGNPENLMEEKISELDQSHGKTSKSVNLRADSYKKLNTYSKLLNIPESEVCRRLLYYVLETGVANSADKTQLVALKSKVILLQTQIEESMKTLFEIIEEIEEIEERKN